MNDHQHGHPKGFVKFFLSWQGVVLTFLLALLSYYLLTQHMEHIALALPYLVLLACPLMHIFHHGGHGHGHSDGNDKE